MKNANEIPVILHNEYYDIMAIFPNWEKANKAGINGNLDWFDMASLNYFEIGKQLQIKRAIAYQKAIDEKRELLEMGLTERTNVIIELNNIISQNQNF